jgi:hypothetical protein
MIRLVALVASVLLSALLAAGCGDQCQALADTICGCEPDLRRREACRLDYQTQQQNQPAPSEDQLGACTAALETCTCDALDRNETDKCGYARAGEP